MPVSAYTSNQQVFEHILVVGIGQALSDQVVANARARGAWFKNPDEVKYISDVPAGVKLIAVYAPSVGSDQDVRRRLQQLATRAHAYCVFLTSSEAIIGILNERMRTTEHKRALIHAVRPEESDSDESSEDMLSSEPKEFNGNEPYTYMATLLPEGYEYNVRFVAKEIRAKLVKGRLFSTLTYSQIMAFVGQIKRERQKQWRKDHPGEPDLLQQKKSQKVYAARKESKVKVKLPAEQAGGDLEVAISEFLRRNPTTIYRFTDISKLMSYLRSIGHRNMDRRRVASLLDQALAARDKTLDEETPEKDEHEEGDYLD